MIGGGKPTIFGNIHIWKRVSTHEETVCSETGHQIRVLMTPRSAKGPFLQKSQLRRTYRWWKKSQTTTWHVWNPIHSGIFNRCRISSINSRNQLCQCWDRKPFKLDWFILFWVGKCPLVLERPSNFLGCFSLSWWPNLYCGIYTTYLTMKKQVLNYKFHGSLTSFKRNTRVENFLN